jgi:hypothetical protein
MQESFLSTKLNIYTKKDIHYDIIDSGENLETT